MEYGFVKTVAFSPKVKPADCDFNAQSVISAMRYADGIGASLLVLPELCLTGYTCGDLFFQQQLLSGAEEALRKILSVSEKLRPVVAVGLPIAMGGKLYNCAAVLYKGRILGVIPKTNFPNYGEFYEVRYFAPPPASIAEIQLCGQKAPFGTNLLFQDTNMPDFCFCVELCEDMWTLSPPSLAHNAAGALMTLNLSASPETATKAPARRALIAEYSKRCVGAYIYAGANEGESTTDLVFTSHCLIYEHGELLSESSLFSGSVCASEIDVERLAAVRRQNNVYPNPGRDFYQTVSFAMAPNSVPLTRVIARNPFLPPSDENLAEYCENLLTLQALGLKNRMERSGAKKAVIGVSGGLDSTLALLVSIKACDVMSRPHTDVLSVTMPCFGTTNRTRSNAEILCNALQTDFRCIDITESVTRHFEDIGHDIDVHDVTYENAQARERTQVLMDVANQAGGLVVGTGDLSELALGWSTYNGDHMSMYGINAGVPKTVIREVVRYVADTSSDEALCAVLNDILNTPVSPELLPASDGQIAQKTEELIGPYALNDFYLYYFVKYGFSPKKTLYLAKTAFGRQYTEQQLTSTLATFYRRFFSQQFKRSCMPDGPKVLDISLSPRSNWRMPSDAQSALWLEELK